MFVTDVFDTHEHEPWTRVPFHTTRVHGPWARALSGRGHG